MLKRRAERPLAGVALLFAALGDETRLALLERLSRGGAASITVLAESFDVTRQGISKHLHVLASAGVVVGRRPGREHVFALEPQRLAAARLKLEQISRAWDGALARLKAHVEGR